MFFCYLFGIVALFCHSCMFKQEEEMTLFGKKKDHTECFWKLYVYDLLLLFLRKVFSSPYQPLFGASWDRK